MSLTPIRPYKETNMATINENYNRLQGSYLFANIAKKVADYQATHPDADIIRLGIGDVTLPLVPAVIEAMHKAVDEMGQQETFRGYGPEQGYDFLRKAIVEGDYKPLGLDKKTKFSYPTGLKPMSVISKKSSPKTVSSLFATLYTLYTWTPMSWQAALVKTKKAPSKRLSTSLLQRKTTLNQNCLPPM